LLVVELLLLSFLCRESLGLKWLMRLVLILPVILLLLVVQTCHVELLQARVERLLLKAKHIRLLMMSVDIIGIQKERIDRVGHVIDVQWSFDLPEFVFKSFDLVEKSKVATFKEIALLRVVDVCFSLRKSFKQIVKDEILTIVNVFLNNLFVVLLLQVFFFMHLNVLLLTHFALVGEP
jgi:hypothetical protein